MFQKLKIAKTDEGQQNGSTEEGHVTGYPDTWHEQCEDAMRRVALDASGLEGKV